MASSLPDKDINSDFDNLRPDVVDLSIESTNTERPGRTASQTWLPTENMDRARMDIQNQSNKITDSPVNSDRRPGHDGLDPAMVMPMRKLYKTINEQLLAPTDDTWDLIWTDLKALNQAVNPNHPALKGEMPVAAANEQTARDEQPEDAEQPKVTEEAPERTSYLVLPAIHLALLISFAVAKEAANSDRRGHMISAAELRGL